MQAQEIVTGSRVLISADAKRPLFDARELWAYREVLYALIWREIKIRYAQTLVGAGWVILQPVLTTAVLAILAGRWVGVPTGGFPYVLLAYSGLVPWIYFTHVLNKSSVCLLSTGLLTKAYFPRLLLPMASAIGGLIDVGASGSLLIVLMIYYRVAPAKTILLFPAGILLMALVAFAAGIWVAVLNLFYRDVAYALPFTTQLLFFMTPVAYSTALVPHAWRLVYSLNPMTGVIELWRWALFGRAGQSPAEFLVSLATTALLLGAGLWFFRRHEPTLADVGEM